MTENIKKLIEDLSEIYDKESKDTFVSLYANKKNYRKFLKRRIRTCTSILKGDELENFKKTIENIQEVFKDFSTNNIAVFASQKNNFLRYLKLEIELKNLLIVDSSPYIRPLARLLDEWESFTLLLINSNNAKIYSISVGKIDNIKKMKTDIINKHKKGGWSQARFNRIRKGAINAFLSEVAEALKKKADENIIISGPGTTKNRFIEMLPKELKKRIVDVIDIGIEDEQKLLKESFQLISEREQKQSEQAVLRLKQEILKDGLAVYGLVETLTAVKNGQVDLLIIEKDYKKRGWICEHCQVVKEGRIKTCPYCNNKTSEVDIIEEILEYAERTNANVEFTDDKEIANLGHVGAILRFK
jgi:peptide chain release factor subunit 1